MLNTGNFQTSYGDFQVYSYILIHLISLSLILTFFICDLEGFFLCTISRDSCRVLYQTVSVYSCQCRFIRNLITAIYPRFYFRQSANTIESVRSRSCIQFDSLACAIRISNADIDVSCYLHFVYTFFARCSRSNSTSSRLNQVNLHGGCTVSYHCILFIIATSSKNASAAAENIIKLFSFILFKFKLNNRLFNSYRIHLISPLNSPRRGSFCPCQPLLKWIWKSDGTTAILKPSLRGRVWEGLVIGLGFTVVRLL